MGAHAPKKKGMVHSCPPVLAGSHGVVAPIFRAEGALPFRFCIWSGPETSKISAERYDIFAVFGDFEVCAPKTSG